MMAALAVLNVFPAMGQVDIQRTDYFRGAPVISVVQLPKPAIRDNFSYARLLAARGGKVELSGDPLRAEHISRIFWAGYGINDSQTQRRNVASFDQGYSLLFYLLTTDSVYVYVPADNTLAKIMDTDMRSKIAVAANRDNAIYVGSASIIIAGSPSKAGFKQPRQGRMFMLFEAGRAAQNMELAAMTEGLGFIITEKIDGSKITSLLRMPSGFEPICIMTAGRLSEPLDTASPAVEAARPAEPAAVAPVPPTPTQPEVQIEAQPVVERQKRVLIFVPNRNFPEQAYTEISGMLRLAGMRVDAASTTLDRIRGDLGSQLSADILVRNAVARDYDAVIIVGSNLSARAGTSLNTRIIGEDDSIENFVTRVYNGGGVVGAFARGTEIVARSGLLSSGVKVTGDTSIRRTVSQYGGEYINQSVVVDGRFVTAKDTRDSTLSNLEVGLTGTVGFVEAILQVMNPPQPAAQ